MLRIISLGAAVLAMTFTMGCSSLGKWQSVDEGKTAGRARPGVPYWLPTSVFHVTLEVKEEDDEFEVALAVTSEIVPDTSEEGGLQYLAHASNSLFSDKMKIVVNERGLLESVSADVEDQTGKSLVAIVEIAANVARLAAGVPTPADVKAKASDTEGDVPVVEETCGSVDDQLKKLIGSRAWIPPKNGQEVTLDLMSKREEAKAKAKAAGKAKTKEKAETEVAAVGKVTDACTPKIIFSSKPRGNSIECASRNFCADDQRGVKYRVPFPYEIKASLVVPYGSYSTSSSEDEKPTNPKEWIHETAAVALVPSDDTLTLPFRRVDFVKSVQKATLKNGMLTSLEIDRPSPFLGFLQIPLEVTERILKIPSELLTFKIESLGSQKELIEAQAGVIEATKALEALSEADASSGTDSSQ